MKQYLSNSDILGLYKRVIIGINKKCLNDNYLLKFKRRYLSKIFSKTLIFLVFLFLILLGKFCFGIKFSFLQGKNTFYYKENVLAFIMGNVMPAFFNVLFILLYIPSFIEIDKFKDDLLCSDELNHKLIFRKSIDYYRIYEKLKSVIKINLILNGIAVLIFIVLFIFWKLDKSKKKNENKNNELIETENENENKYKFFPETPTPKF